MEKMGHRITSSSSNWERKLGRARWQLVYACAAILEVHLRNWRWYSMIKIIFALFCCFYWLLVHGEVVNMRINGRQSKVSMESVFIPKQSAVRWILVVQLQDKGWCAFFYLGWYWVWTDQFPTDRGSCWFATKVFSSSIIFQKDDTEAFQVVVLFLVEVYLRVFLRR